MTAEALAAVRKIPLFKSFSDQDCQALLVALSPRRYAQDEVVFRQGAMGDTMVIVLDGRLRVELTDGSGHATELGIIHQGEIVGEMAVLDPAPRAATVTAAAPSVLFELSRTGLSELRASSPSASSAIIAAIIGDVTRRLRQIDVRIERELNPAAATATPAVAPRPEVATSLFSRIWARLTGD